MFVKSLKISSQQSAMSNSKMQDTGYKMQNNRPSSLVPHPSVPCILHRASFVLLLLAFLFLPSLAGATMQDYCLVPPYVKRDVSVNIMIFMDNSDDML